MELDVNVDKYSPLTGMLLSCWRRSTLCCCCAPPLEHVNVPLLPHAPVAAKTGGEHHHRENKWNSVNCTVVPTTVRALAVSRRLQCWKSKPARRAGTRVSCVAAAAADGDAVAADSTAAPAPASVSWLNFCRSRWVNVADDGAPGAGVEVVGGRREEEEEEDDEDEDKDEDEDEAACRAAMSPAMVRVLNTSKGAFTTAAPSAPSKDRVRSALGFPAAASLASAGLILPSDSNMANWTALPTSALPSDHERPVSIFDQSSVEAATQSFLPASVTGDGNVDECDRKEHAVALVVAAAFFCFCFFVGDLPPAAPFPAPSTRPRP